MSSTTTVGIIGHTGRVGSQVLKNLITYHEQGQIEVIVLHRPSSDISKVPSGIETRVIDLTQDEPEKHLAAIQGINVIMSLLSMEALHLQTPLMKAMTRSDALQAFTLAEIGSPFTEAEYSDPRLSTYTKGAEVVEALGLKDKFTTITSGDYPDYFFGYNLLGVNLRENSVKLYGDGLNRKILLASAPYLGAAMAQLTLTVPSEYAGKSIHMYDYAPTGQEIIDVFTSIHGKPTAVSTWDQEALGAKYDEGPFGALEATLIKHWGHGELENAGQVVEATGGWREEPKGWEIESLETLIRGYL